VESAHSTVNHDPILRLFRTFMVINCVLDYTVFEERPPIAQSDNQKCMSVGPTSPASHLPTTPSESTDTSDQHHVQSSWEQTLQTKSQTMEMQSEVIFPQSRKEQLGDNLCNASVNA
jgi:hypothetical protein